ncbi:hypothetical protein HYV50_05735 [Candidatus Pacearchaeota archaeon]|nr:hypothetical protein [Candidatus Pacearchaeota archaeon]
MISKQKRGLSPVIATMLLVSLAVVLAVIVFFWARSFLAETITKEGVDIDQSCSSVDFEVEADSSLRELTITIVNKGDVPIYNVEIKKKGLGEEKTITDIENQNSISPGETATISLSSLDLRTGDEISVVPILLGETETYKKAYVCEDNYAKETTVI